MYRNETQCRMKKMWCSCSCSESFPIIHVQIQLGGENVHCRPESLANHRRTADFWESVEAVLFSEENEDDADFKDAKRLFDEALGTSSGSSSSIAVASEIAGLGVREGSKVDANEPASSPKSSRAILRRCSGSRA